MPIPIAPAAAERPMAIAAAIALEPVESC